MRWFWIDRYTEFIHGKSATAIKNVSFSEPHLVDYVPGFPMMPNSLIVEGLAQTGGLLLGEYSQFKERVILAKLAKSEFHRPAFPGDSLIYRVELDRIDKDGAVMTGTSHVGDDLQAEVEIFFVHLAEEVAGEALFFPADFLRLLRNLAIYDIGIDIDGNRVEPPPHMVDAEKNLSAK
ncbi:MAG: beta-hydroxyacyl-ACP dehydratase [Pirellulaceae bacterium]|nr:beta-hydroxyacyl-ACP dehydratase [Pirellulaceae bacterium]